MHTVAESLCVDLQGNHMEVGEQLVRECFYAHIFDVYTTANESKRSHLLTIPMPMSLSVLTPT